MTATTSACRRPSSSCRAGCACRCASGSVPTAASTRRSTQPRSKLRSPCSSASASSRSRSAICTPGATRVTSAGRARRSPARSPTPMSRCPPRSCRRSRSSSGSRRRSSTPMSARCCRAISRGWNRAAPGPACYGQGGAEPTVTDANLVLGYLDPANFLGGARRLHEDLAARAVDRIAAGLGIDRLAAAHGIHRVINTNMAEGVRLVSVRRGVDPRRFALFAFGGAAGLHATDIARQLGLVRVIVPRVASVLSAWGMLATDLRFELSRTHIGYAKVLDGAAVKHLFDEMEAEGLARLRASFAGPARAARSVDMRYGEQVFEITVPLDDVDWSAADPLPQIVERFHRRHEALYTYSMPDQEAVLVNARVAVSGILEVLPQESDLPAAPPAPAAGERRIYFDDWVTAPVYIFDTLAPAQTIAGPAIVESATTTVLLRPGDRATITPQGWLDIAVGSAAEG